jgi:hypothetical protein
VATVRVTQAATDSATKRLAMTTSNSAGSLMAMVAFVVGSHRDRSIKKPAAQ